MWQLRGKSKKHLFDKKKVLTSYFSDRPWKEDQVAVMMCWKCPLNHWDASLGMFLFNLIYLNFSDILEVFCTKPTILSQLLQWKSKSTLTLFPWTSITSATSSCPLAEHRWLDEFDLRLEPVLRWHKLGGLWWGFKLEQFTNKNVVKKWEYRMIPWLVNSVFQLVIRTFQFRSFPMIGPGP